MRILSGIALLIFLGIILIFAVQNRGSVTVNFLQWAQSFPLAALVVASYALGMFSGWSVVGFLRKNIHRVQEPRT